VSHKFLTGYSSKSKARAALTNLLDSDYGALFDVYATPDGDEEWLGVIKGGIAAIARQRRLLLKMESTLNQAFVTLLSQEQLDALYNGCVEAWNFTCKDNEAYTDEHFAAFVTDIWKTAGKYLKSTQAYPLPASKQTLIYYVETKAAPEKPWIPGATPKRSLAAARKLAKCTPCYQSRIVKIDRGRHTILRYDE
jgi:hypothetical protein